MDNLVSYGLSPLKTSCKMTHINQKQRYEISLLRSQGKTLQEIGLTIGRDKSVVSREIRRNCDKRNSRYEPELAQRKYEKRLSEKPKSIRFTQEIKTHIENLLKQEYSPEQIVGYSKAHDIACVSHEVIYQYVWRDKKKGGRLHESLRNHGRKYRKRGASKDKRGIIQNRIDISQRPPIVEEKIRVGDFEADTIIGKNHQGAIVTLNDRRTGIIRMKKVESRDSNLVADAIIALLSGIKEQIHTITSDNGKEFAQHMRISKELDLDFFFARPYHSWERGANENCNRLIT